MEAISEAFNKCFVADFIFTVSRTIEDKNTNGGRIFIAKNRNGPDGLVYPIFMDTSNVNIKVLPQTNESVEDILENSAKKQMQKLREKYKDFKKEN
jgi:delta-aminolevulinic acid dehydratase/porphobilinogen synthase